MSEARSLILAVVASVAIMLGWKFIHAKFFEVKDKQVSSWEAESVVPEVEDLVEYKPRSETVGASPRVHLQNEKIHASVALKGAQIDDVELKKYLNSLDEDSGNVLLLSPEGSEENALVEFGWVDPKHEIKLPNRDSVWAVEGSSNDGSFALRWDNGAGLVFRLKFQLDSDYMLTVVQEVENNNDQSVQLAYYGRINRARDASKKSFWLSHEGAIGSFANGVKEWTYKDIEEASSIRISGVSREDSGRSWIGFADKYWFAALIPSNDRDSKTAFRTQHLRKSDEHRFQVDFSRSHGVIKPGHSVSATTYLYLGAKELSLLDKYRTELNIPLLDKAVDFGVLYFITKPVFLLLAYFNKIFGNFGLAIVMLTITIKLIVFPLSTRSYTSMFKLRKLQPEISRIKELYKSDDLRVSKEIAALFKKHKVSPFSGFLPILVQIPVFFALYKVLFVTIEMRHAPLFAWIKDLSSPDSANFLNLFGMLPFQPPIVVGVLPVLLGVTMILQQKVMQQDQASLDGYGVMKFLPYIFIFIFSSFPSGLVLYWTCSNILTIVQQLVIRRFVCKGVSLGG